MSGEMTRRALPVGHGARSGTARGRARRAVGHGAPAHGVQVVRPGQPGGSGGSHRSPVGRGRRQGAGHASARCVGRVLGGTPVVIGGVLMLLSGPSVLGAGVPVAAAGLLVLGAELTVLGSGGAIALLRGAGGSAVAGLTGLPEGGVSGRGLLRRS